MAKYLLRVDAVNLWNVIDDTDQLSVRRGGGLMALNAATELKESLLDPDISQKLTEIATGASIALFELDADENEAEAIRKHVADTLSLKSLPYQTLEGKKSQLPLKHGTFVVDVVAVSEADNVIQQADQLVTAKNRWRQMQQPTLSLGGGWSEEKKRCEVDRTRPATEKLDINADTKNAPVSLTVFDRWHYGRGARQRFYEHELRHAAVSDSEVASLLHNLHFTNDLLALAGKGKSNGDGSEGVDAIPKDLLDKIAVFYVDGNKFGQKGRDIFANGGSQGFREWSAKLKEHHRTLLAGLIALADKDPAWKNGDEIRLETLLWGGDEILWVVPAWKGWELAKWFFSQMHEVTIEQKREELSYACGLVFCHYKAPIKNVIHLARKLGDAAKDKHKGQNVHRLAYEVLESFDDISGDLDQHRGRFLPKGRSLAELVIDPANLEPSWSVLERIARCPEFPTRQLYTLTEKWRKGDAVGKPEGRIRPACKDAGIDLEPFLKAFGGDVAWTHLLQMLPYVPSP